MFNFYFDLTFLNVFAIPLYVLFFITFFLIHVNRKVVNISKNVKIFSSSYSLVSFKNLYFLIIPFILLLFLNFLSFRSFENIFFYSECSNFYFYQKFFFFLFLLFFFKSYLIANALVFKSSQNYFSEIIISIWWIFYIIMWLFVVNSVLSFIILIEILNILILIIIYYTFVINRNFSTIFLNYKYINFYFNIKFSFIISLLFFVWCSAIVLLLLFWSISYITTISYSLNFSVLEVLFLFNISWSGWLNTYAYIFIFFIFFFCILLKIAILPMQFWLIFFYKNLSLLSLVFYLLFFYVYSIVVFFNIFFGYFYFLNIFWFIFFFILLIFSFFFIFFNFSEIYLLKNFLAISSIVNILILFCYFLSFCY